MNLVDPAPAHELTAAALRDEMARWSEHRRYVDTVLAGYAARLAELTRQAAIDSGRSEKAAAFEAQRETQRVTGLNRRETSGLTEVGELVAPPPPWLSSVGAAVEGPRSRRHVDRGVA